MLRRVALAVCLSLLAVSVLGYGVYRYYDGKLNVISIHSPGQHGASSSRSENYLLVGSDTRNIAGGQNFQAQRGSADFVTGARSDTVMLVHIPAGRAKATIVSFPRDSYVTIPAYSTPSGQQRPAHKAKLNEAFSDAGPGLLVSLIETLTGLSVDHYVQIDFAGFQKMVDALGGLTLCVATTRHDKDSGDFLTAGQHRDVRGAQALAFVRDRKGLPNGDIDRIKDQQYFLSQVLKKTLSAGTLTNPFRLNGLLSALTSSITVDSAFGFSQIRTLASRLRHLDPAHVTFETVPLLTSNGTRTFEGRTQSVVLLNTAAAAQLFQRLRTDTRPPGHGSSPRPSSPPLTVNPSQVLLAVQNATTTPGLAARTAVQLRAVGFRISAVGTVPAAPGTRIVFSPDRADSARTLAAAIPGSTLVSDPNTSRQLVLVLGEGPLTVLRVRASEATTTPARAGSPATAAPLTSAAASCAP